MISCFDVPLKRTSTYTLHLSLSLSLSLSLCLSLSLSLSLCLSVSVSVSVFEVHASRVIDRRNLPLTRSLEGIVMNEMDARHPPPPPLPDTPGKGVSFIQRDAVYVTLVNLHVHFPTATFSTHSQTKILIYCS